MRDPGQTDSRRVRRPRRASAFVRQHPDTKGVAFQAVVKYPDPASSQWRTMSKTFRKRVDADTWASEKENEVLHTTGYQPPERELFGEFLARWLDDTAAARVADTTLESYRQIATHAVRVLGARPLETISTRDLDALYTTLWRDSGLSPRTIRYVHSVVKSSLNDAVRWRLIPSNPAADARPPKLQRKPLEILTWQESRQWVKAANEDRLKGLWRFIAQTGCRRGEALGIQWQDIDWEKKTVLIQRAIVEQRGRTFIHDTKTGFSRRTVNIPPGLLEVLREHRHQQRLTRISQGDQWIDHDWAFTTKTGSYLRPRDALRRFKRVVDKAGLSPGVRIHDLRHALATTWLAEGIPAKVVAERLGHASVSTTLSLYGHAIPGMQAEASAAMERLLLADEP